MRQAQAGSWEWGWWEGSQLAHPGQFALTSLIYSQEEEGV